MEHNKLDSKDLEKLLASTGEPDAPPWLQQRIMSAISNRQLSLFERIREWWLRPRSFRFVPAWVVFTVTATVCAFWLGMLVEQGRKAGEADLVKPVLPALADNADANYLIGRGLLAAGRKDQALTYLRQAVQQNPGSAEFTYWQGVAYWELGQADQERQSYLVSMQDQPGYLPAQLNLGHNYLESGEYQQALAQYEKVLRKDPAEATALYNRALSYQLLRDTDRAKQAFSEYLDYHRQGKWAFRAIEHLQQLEDFTFRSYRVGERRVILNAEALLGPDSPVRQKELSYLKQALAGAAGEELHLVVYHQGNRDAAKTAVMNLQVQLKKELAEGQDIPVRCSWFDVAETFIDGNGLERQRATSLLIFTRSIEESNRRKSI